jgi:hypothetical protein
VTSYSQENVDLATLDTQLTSEGVNALGVDVNNYLIGRGDTTGVNDPRLISVWAGTPPFPTSPTSQVDNITGVGTFSIDTDQYPLLQAIILDDTGGAQNLTVTGNGSVLVATGNGTNTITLQDHGNDKVYVGTGSNTVTGGSGSDSIYGAGSADSLTGGSGAYSLLYDSGDNATLVGGSGAHDRLDAGPGSHDSLMAGGAQATLQGGSGIGDTLDGGSSADVWLVAGTGKDAVLTATGPNDLLFTGHGDHAYVQAFGHDDWIFAGGAGGSGEGQGTLVAGGNDEQVHIGRHGNDTIVGSGSGDAVFFDDQAYNHGQGVTISTNHAGVTTVSFADTGQHFKVSGVQTLNFSDGHVIHL